MAKKQEFDLISYLEGWFSKLPPLSLDVRKRLVHIAPILALVFGILGVVGSIGSGLISPLLIFFGGPKEAMGGIVFSLLALASSVLVLCAYPSLKKYKQRGWTFLFWSQILSIVGSVFQSVSLVGIVIGLFGLYLLYQIKSLYK